MASTSEKTNAKNLENIHIANATNNTITIFDPSNKLIQKPSLVTYETGFSTRMQAVNSMFSVEKNAVSIQTAAFKQVKTRLTKIMKAARGQGLPAESIENLMTTVRKLRGVRVTDRTPDNPATPGVDESRSNRSVSQNSIAGMLEHLDLFEEKLKAEVNYKPNEEEHKIEAISEWIAGLRAIHNAVLDARAATTNARQDRDAFGYNKTDGLIVRMNALKQYVGSILDTTDARYKKIKGLKFVDPTTK